MQETLQLKTLLSLTATRPTSTNQKSKKWHYLWARRHYGDIKATCLQK